MKKCDIKMAKFTEKSTDLKSPPDIFKKIHTVNSQKNYVM